MDKSKDLQRGVINNELDFYRGMIKIDQNTIKKGKLLKPETFVFPAVFSILYYANGLVLWLFNKPIINPDWFMIGLAITVGLTVLCVFGKWAVWNSLVQSSKMSILNSETQISKLEQELEELEEENV